MNQHQPKIGFIIQARMKSGRLPGKVLLNLPLSGGKPLIGWITDQLSLSRYKAKTVIATADTPENAPLVEFCASHKISCFSGDEENVLSRFISIIKREKFDVVVRITGDNPVLDMAILDSVIETHISHSNDYTKTVGLPVGMNVEVVSALALLRLENVRLDDADKEHVTHFIWNSDDFKKELVPFFPDAGYSTLRLTVDYPSDFLVLSALLSVSQNEGITGIGLVKHTLDNYPWIFEVNSTNVQKKQFKDEHEELQAAIELLRNADLFRAAIKLEKNAR